MIVFLIAVHKNKNYDADFIFFFTDILSLLSASFYPFFGVKASVNLSKYMNNLILVTCK